VKKSTAAQPQSFLWHDYETFGTDPKRDRPAEFACWRTNENFQPIEEPESFRCKPTLDYLPDPLACAITGIGPEAAYRDGLPEPEFAARVHAQMSRGQTCTLGYNSIRFDDEITRHLNWRNFLDPYEREWANGNSRFDFIDLTRATYALRPNAIEWPSRADGHPSFKLSDLTEANALTHSHAHAALSDVEATLGLASLLRLRQPRLVDFALELRRKSRVIEMLDWQQRTPLLHVSQRFPAERGCTAIVVPLALHPSQSGKVIVVDTFPSPMPLLSWPIERLAEMLVAPADSGERVALGLKLVHANRAPFLAPISVLAGVDLGRIQLDRAQSDIHTEQLRNAGGLDKKVQQIFRLLDSSVRDPADPDAALYEGFVPDSDRALAKRFTIASPEELGQIAAKFGDVRLRALAFRFRARHYPVTLNPSEQRIWLDQCRVQLQQSPRSLANFDTATDELAARLPDVAMDLRTWGARVRKHAGLGLV